MARSALHLVVLVCVVTAGCSVLGPEPTRQERAVAALEDATTAVDTAGTYRFELELRAETTGEGRTETAEGNGSGVVDADARRMRSTAKRDGEARTTYVLNRTVYRECADPWGGYGVEELDEDEAWSSQSPLVRQLGLLESGALYYNGTDTVDGTEATLLTGEPTEQALTRYRDDGQSPVFGGPNVEDIRLRVWLDPETDRPVRTELRFRVTEDGESATARLRTRYSGYGESVTVELPEKARTEARELGCPGE